MITLNVKFVHAGQSLHILWLGERQEMDPETRHHSDLSGKTFFLFQPSLLEDSKNWPVIIEKVNDF